MAGLPPMSSAPHPGLTVHVRLFAALRDRLGQPGCTLQVPAGTRACDLFPMLFPTETAARREGRDDWPGPLRYAVGLAFVEAERPLKDGDEVALLPPLGGG